jgi:hypothetical protein
VIEALVSRVIGSQGWPDGFRELVQGIDGGSQPALRVREQDGQVLVKLAPPLH